MDIGGILAIAALALTIGGAIAMFGRFQGTVTEKTEQNSKDIDGLWEHQRKQDTHCAIETRTNAEEIAGMKATLAAVKESTDETRADVKDIRDIVMKGAIK